MKGLLLDTSIAIFGQVQPERIPLTVREQLELQPCYLSVITYWEVMLKSMKGKLPIRNPRTWWFAALEDFEATPLPLDAHHVAAVYSLPSIHRDPYDRVLIAQAIAEDLTLVTTNSEIPRYSVPTLYVP